MNYIIYGFLFGLGLWAALLVATAATLFVAIYADDMAGRGRK